MMTGCLCSLVDCSLFLLHHSHPHKSTSRSKVSLLSWKRALLWSYWRRSTNQTPLVSLEYKSASDTPQLLCYYDWWWAPTPPLLPHWSLQLVSVVSTHLVSLVCSSICTDILHCFPARWDMHRLSRFSCYSRLLLFLQMEVISNSWHLPLVLELALP